MKKGNGEGRRKEGRQNDRPLRESTTLTISPLEQGVANDQTIVMVLPTLVDYAR